MNVIFPDISLGCEPKRTDLSGVNICAFVHEHGRTVEQRSSGAFEHTSHLFGVIEPLRAIPCSVNQVPDGTAQVIQRPDDKGITVAQPVQRRLGDGLKGSLQTRSWLCHLSFTDVPLRAGPLGAGLPRLQCQHAHSGSVRVG